MKFSQRIGKSPVKVDFQIESMNSELRTGLWNVCTTQVFNQISSATINHSGYHSFFLSLWCNFFKEPVDAIDNYVPNTLKEIKTRFFRWKWYEVYDFLEFI